MMQNESPIDLKAEYRAINILSSALIIGVIIFLIITVACVKWLKTQQLNGEMDKIFLALASTIAAVCLVIAFSGFNKQILKFSNSNMRLREKLEIYRAAIIRFMALCEGAALFGVICFFLTGNYWFVLVTLIMLCAMIWRKPTKAKLITELQLDSQQQIELQ